MSASFARFGPLWLEARLSSNLQLEGGPARPPKTAISSTVDPRVFVSRASA